MKKITGLVVLFAIVIGIALLTQQGAEERAVRRVIDEIQSAALNGFQLNNPNALDTYFATVQEGAVAASLTETQQAYQDFVAKLSGSTVQFHSFDIKAIEVHEDARLLTFHFGSCGCWLTRSAMRIAGRVMFSSDNDVIEDCIDHTIGMVEVAFNSNLTTTAALINAVVKAGGDEDTSSEQQSLM